MRKAHLRFYLPVWYTDHITRTCKLPRVRFVGNHRFPYGGAWVGVLDDGHETIDFGLRSEAQACLDYSARVANNKR